MSGLIEKAKNYVTEKIESMPKPTATINDVDLKGVNLSGVTYLAKVGVMNPYSKTIPICEIDYTLKSDGRVIASGKIPDPGSIVGEKTTVLEVAMLVPHSILKSLMRDIWRDWDIDYSLDVALIIDLPVFGNFTLPLSTTGEVKLPTIGSFFGGGGDADVEKKE